MSAVGGGEWSASLSGRFTPGRRRLYALNGWLGGLHSESGHFETRQNIAPPKGIETQNVQIAVNRCSD